MTFTDMIRKIGLLAMFVLISGLGYAQGVRIVYVDPIQDRIDLQNFSDSPVDMSSYQICTRFRYSTLGSLTSSDLTIGAGERIILSWSLTDGSSDVGLYSSGSFGSADAMVDFMQYGGGGIGRESVAVSKGIWSSGDFVSGDPAYEYTGDGSQDGATAWEAIAVSNEETEGPELPEAISLDQNFPNPFNPSTIIRFNLAESGLVTLKVYNVVGQEVASLISNNLSAGEHTVSFNGAGLASGIYEYRLVMGNDFVSRRMTLIK